MLHCKYPGLITTALLHRRAIATTTALATTQLPAAWGVGCQKLLCYETPIIYIADLQRAI